MSKIETIVLSIIVLALIILGANALLDVKNKTIGYQILDSYTLASTEWGGVGSSTSLTISTNNADKVGLNIDLTTASTVSEVDWVVYYSNDASTWYAQDDFTDTSATVDTHGATALTHKWTPGSATQLYKRINYTDIVSKYMKFTFTAVGATSTIAAEAVTSQTTQ